MPEAYELVVEVGPDILKGASKCSPIEALEELVWNALDADAKSVEIVTSRNDLGRLDSIKVVDDGIGFEVSAKDAFGSYGTSLKKLRDRTPSGRIQHGREGRGRYKALTLGRTATWVSTSKTLKGFLITTITVSNDAPNRLRPIEEPTKATTATGTCVSIADVSEEASDYFLGDVAQELALRFAPYLLAYKDVVLTVDGVRVDPSNNLLDQRIEQVSHLADLGGADAEIQVCVWRQTDAEGKAISKVYFCDQDGFAIEVHPGYTRRLGVSMTAYVKSPYFSISQMTGYTGIGTTLDPTAHEFLKRARVLMTQLNRQWLHRHAKEQVAELKSENLYPFEGEPKSDVEKAEREVFDIVAEQLHVLAPAIAQDKPADRKRKMEALRVAISTEPSVQEFLIKEVLGLKPEQQKDLYDVLQHVPLSSVVTMAKTILDRLHFLSGLRMILFEPELKRKLRERTQLHRILVEHLWLFGEEFHLAADDVSLKKVLLRHREILGLDETAFELQSEVATTLNDIPDLVLYRTRCSRPGHVEHLVVELKAPRVVCGEDEFSQIEKYARTVAGCDDFDKSRTKWRFVLVNNSFNDGVFSSKAQQRDRPEGLVLDHDNYQVWAMPWSGLIQDAEGRHQFLKEKLDYQISDDKPGLEYLRNKFADYLPPSMLEPQTEEESTLDEVEDEGSEEK